MKNKEVCDSIKRWADNIEQIVCLANIKGKEYITNYKVKDLFIIDELLRKCERCGNYFLPNPNFKQYQKYCDIHCRNKATKTHRYELKLDERQRPVDLLRKSIYERKYRARRDNVVIDVDSYNTILKKLSVLVKQRWNITETEYNNKIADLQYEYDTVVQRGKGDT